MMSKIGDPIEYLLKKGVLQGAADFERLSRLITFHDEAIDDLKTKFPKKAFMSRSAGNDSASLELLAAKYDFPFEKVTFIVPGSAERLKEHIEKRVNVWGEQIVKQSTLAANIKAPIVGGQIFWSWQSHFSKSRNIVEDSLDPIISKLNESGFIKETLFKEIAMRPDDGANPIDQNIPKKIKASRYFIADVTPIWVWEDADRTRKVLYPNPNICVEVGYAVEALHPSQILLLAFERTEPSFSHGHFPFDIAQRPRIHFTDKTDLKKKIFHALATSLKNNGELSKDHFDQIIAGEI